MAKQSKNRTHGRRAHKASGGCLTGKIGYPTKREAEDATGGPVKRCDNCRQWHSAERRRRGAR